MYEPVSGPLDLAAVADRLRILELTLSGDAATSLQTLVTTAEATIPGATAVSITMLSRGSFTTDATSNGRALAADLVQYELQAGPCLDATVLDRIYNPQDLATDDRWPTFGKRVSKELGINSCLSIQLATESHRGSLNVYGDEPGAFDRDSVLTAFIVSTAAVGTLNQRDVLYQLETLQAALKTSREIGIAIGIVMLSRHLDRDAAFDLLKVASQNSNRKISDLASLVADTGAAPDTI